jgi:hypothetical protein
MSSDSGPAQIDAATAILTQIRNEIGVYGAVHGLAGLMCLAIAIWRIRPLPERGNSPPTNVLALRENLQTPPMMSLETILRGRLPAIGNDPVAWKERHVGASDFHLLFNVGWLYFYVILAGMGVIGLFVLDPHLHEEVRSTLSVAFRVIVIAVSIVLLAAFGMHACAAISREQEQGTLATLLSLPLSPASILASKLKGILLRRWNTFLGLAVVGITAILTSSIHPLSVLAIACVVLVHCLFAICLGMFLSITCRSTLQARLIWVVTMIGLITASLIFEHKFEFDGPAFTHRMVGIGGSAPMTIWFLGDYRPRLLSKPAASVSVLTGVGLYAIGAVLLWFAGLWRLSRSKVR